MKIAICEGTAEEALFTKNLIVDKGLAYEESIVVLTPHELESLIRSSSFDIDVVILGIALDRNAVHTAGVTKGARTEKSGTFSYGLNIARKLNAKKPECKIIYIGNLDEYTSQIYETAHSYFLMAKEQDTMIARALMLVGKQIYERQGKLKVVENREEVEIPFSKIRYITRYGRMTRIQADKEYRTYTSLQDLGARLLGNFSRCHEGYIVNFDYLVDIRSNCVTLKEGVEVSIGRAYKRAFLADYATYLVGGGAGSLIKRAKLYLQINRLPVPIKRTGSVIVIYFSADIQLLSRG